MINISLGYCSIHSHFLHFMCHKYAYFSGINVIGYVWCLFNGYAFSKAIFVAYMQEAVDVG